MRRSQGTHPVARIRTKQAQPLLETSLLQLRARRNYLVQKYLAEGEGFEPSRACALPVFKTGAIGRSATPPGDFVIIASG